MANYKLTPAPVPSRAGGGRPAVYLQILADFAALKEASARVDYQREPDTIYNGLATALRKHPEFKNIAVVRRADEVYLRRTK